MATRFDYGGAPAPIPDNSPVGVTLVIEDVPAVESIEELSLWLTHTFRSDIIITLIPPDGVSYMMSDTFGGSGQDFGAGAADAQRWKLRQDAAQPITNFVTGSPAVSTWRPETSFATIPPQVAGDWSVKFVDETFDDTGTVQALSLFVILASTDDELEFGPADAPADASPVTVVEGDSLQVGGAVAPFDAHGATVVGEAVRGDNDVHQDFSLAHPDFEEAFTEGQFIGASRPVQVVEVRKGTWQRGYAAVPADEELDAAIPKESRGAPWMAWWVPETDWVEIEGVASLRQQQNFEQNGATVCTLVANNARLAPRSAGDNDYHVLERGYLSPLRGLEPDDRPPVDAEPTEYGDMMRNTLQVRVWQGYGEPQRGEDGSMPDDGGTNGSWSFTGWTDDLDLSSLPANLTFTARDGMPLTDERMFGNNVSKQLTDPTIFSDRLDADDITRVGSDPEASSARAGSPASYVLDESNKTAWRSDDHTTPGNTEWVQIRLPAGRYTDFILHPAYAGMELYIGFNAKTREDGSPPKVDGEEVVAGWVDLNGGALVPGAAGGWAYTRHIESVSGTQQTRKIGAEIVTGDDAIVRVAFRSLKKISDDTYRAGVIRLSGRKRKLSKDAAENKWILVDDVSDVVKVCLRWAGYRDWNVESTGARLAGKWVFNRSNYLIDPIKKAQEMTHYVFFMSAPEDGDRLSIPTFRQNRSRYSPEAVREIADSDLLTEVSFKESQVPLAALIRVRGKVKRDDQGGTTLGGDLTNRVMGVYRPPWGKRLGGAPFTDRIAGFLKHVAHTFPELKTVKECLVMCRLMALEQALVASQAVIEIPGHSGVSLDQQVGVVDEATGINSRMWVAERTSEFTAGPQTKWTSTAQGPLMDTPDIAAIIDELESAPTEGQTGTVVSASFNGAVAMPKNKKGLYLPLDIVVAGTVANVTASLYCKHPATWDLAIELIHEDGTTVGLARYVGEEKVAGFGSRDNPMNLSDGASTDIADGTPPWTGTYRPSEPLSAFDGLSSKGQWRMRFIDEWGHGGSVYHAAIEITLA